MTRWRQPHETSGQQCVKVLDYDGQKTISYLFYLFSLQKKWCVVGLFVCARQHATLA
jgi:hypothetical protein